jgi:hypothetical protein
VSTNKPAPDDGAPMSRGMHLVLVLYLLGLGAFLLWALIKLNGLNFPDMALAIEAPQGAGSVQAPPAPVKTPAGADAGRDAAASTDDQRTATTGGAVARPVLTDAFPHLRPDPSPATPIYELALYGSGFVKESQVRLNGTSRTPKDVPAGNLIYVVPMPGDLVGTGVLVIEVMNPGANVSNALALKVDRPTDRLNFVFFEWTITREMQLILMALFAGGLGGFVHALKSLTDFIGNRTAITSWSWWYVGRPFLGAALAFIMYSVLRGGFLTGSPADVRVVNPFGVIAVAALVGMFADQATQKLAEVFDTLFKADDKRSGKLAAPVIDRLEPPTVVTGSGTAVDVKIIGDRLGATRTVKIDGKERTPERVSDKEVVVKLQPAELHKSGVLSISVVTADATSPSVKLFVSDLTISTATLPDGKVGADYPATTVTATLGTPGYRWSLDGANLKIDAAGGITGKPNKAGPATVAVTVTDASGASTTREFTIQVAP